MKKTKINRIPESTAVVKTSGRFVVNLTGSSGIFHAPLLAHASGGAFFRKVGESWESKLERKRKDLANGGSLSTTRANVQARR